MLILLLTVVLLIAALALILTGFRIVPARQALVIYNIQTGWAQQVLIGPRLVFKLPVLEGAIVLDLTFQQVRLRMGDLTTADCLAVEASMDVDFELHPDFLRTTDINRIMPLLPKAPTVVENLARYLLQEMVAQSTAADLLTRPQLRARLEREIHRMLSDSVRWLGVRVIAIRLLLRPAAAMLEAELAAQAQARTLLALINSTGADRELLAQILPLQLLKARSGDAHLLASLNLQTARGGNGAVPAIHWVVGETR